MKHRLIFIFFSIVLLFSGNTINAQKYKTDSLYSILKESKDINKQLEILNELTVYLRRSYPDSALQYGKQAENLALKLNDQSKLAECYKNIGNIYNGKDNFKFAVDYYQKSLNLYREMGDSLGIAKNYNNLGALNRNQGNLSLSLEYYQKSLALRELMGDRFGMGMTYNNIGNVHYYMGDHDLALEYYFKSLEIRNEFNDEMGMAGCYNNIGSIYIFKKNYGSGIEYLKKALKIYNKFEDKLGIGHTYKNIGSAYFKLNEYILALEYFKRSLEIDKELKDQLGTATTYNEMAKIYNALNNFSQAKIYAEKALDISREIGALLEKKNAFEQISVAYEGLSDYRKALEFHKYFLSTNDSIFNIEKIKELESIETKYQVENKQLQIEKLKSENELKTVKLEKMRIRFILILILSTTFIVFIIGLLFTRQKLRKKNTTIYEQNEEISAQKDELEKHRNHLEKLVQERTQDLELAKQKAEESDKLKSSFLANMSHEIRTPMNAIVGFSNLLIENNIDDKAKVNYKHEIASNCFSLLNLIDNILDLAKIETKQIHFNKKIFNLNELMEDIYYSFIEIANSKQINFLFRNDSQTTVTLKTDPYRIKQILSNLIDNAIKFTEEGFVEVSYSVNNEHITFEVKDTGIGMNQKQLDHLFTRFSKFEKEKQKLYGGAGLGLAICKHLTELLEGQMWVESKPDKGSTFYVKFPTVYEEKTIQSNTEVKKSSQNWKNKTILIAEDNSSNLYFFKMLLEETNISIDHAKNGNEAIKKTKANTPDLILMDIKMPGMDGLEATRLIRKENPKIPIIAQTAFSMENDEKLSLKAGCNAYITKPIQKHQLFSLLDKFLS